MKKIFIEKNESVGEVMEKVIAADDSEVAIVVPRNAKLKDSANNFGILKREAEAAKKHLLIESVDEEVLSLAEAAKIEGLHPLFSGSTRSLSDIVPQEGESVPEDVKPKAKKGAKKGVKKVSLKVPPSPMAVPRPVHEDVETRLAEEMAEVEQEEAERPAVRRHFSAAEMPAEEAFDEEIAEGRSRRWIGALAVLGVVLAGGVLLTTYFLARANIAVNLKLSPWQAQVPVTASKAVAQVDAAKSVIPGELFKDERNVTQLFPASGEAVVSQKATARLTIYNAYSSEAQTLVATTRFETPDGKVFRLDSQIIVPGAEIKDGKIIPSSIKANVSADKAGEDYNVGPVAKLTIPGFKGTPKFQGFYGVLEEGAKDGFVGRRKVPTDADIQAAKDKTVEILKSSLQGNLLSRRPKDFKVIDDTADLVITKLTVNKNTDANGNFSVFGEARFQAMAFREDDLKALLLTLARKEHADAVFHDVNLSYKDVTVAYDKGELRFSVSADGNLAADFDKGSFAETLAGRPVGEARDRILKLPGLADAKVDVWPFWLRSLPRDPGRIKVDLNYL
jgi:hypothetical protein